MGPLDVLRRLRVFVGIKSWDDLNRSLERRVATRPREIRLGHVPAFDVSRPVVRGTGHGHLRPIIPLVDAHLLH